METTSSGANKYPGQKCHQDTQCVGLGTCQDGHCLGRAQGGDCRTSDDCSVGTYCKDKVCENLLAEGMVSDFVNIVLQRVWTVHPVHRL